MGYMHIDNLYKNQSILLFKECYALEKIHGTSAHVSWRCEPDAKEAALHFYGGGEKHERFAALFDHQALAAAFTELGHVPVTIYGEAYGGKQQGMGLRYGQQLRFVAFDVQINNAWLSVPNAEQIVKRLGLEFVHYVRCSTDLAALDEQRDATSEQAIRNGIEGFQPREGVVLRPLQEFCDAHGNRIIAKHKRPEERETKTVRDVVDPSKMRVLEEAEAIATEWVTPTRLEHVLDHLRASVGDVGIQHTAKVIAAMVDDVLREGRGEIVDTKEARKAIGAHAARLFKARVQRVVA